jgi:predicted nucleic acid-binding protein
MNGKLVDTNIIVYLSKRKIDLRQIIFGEEQLFISIITYMEVLGFRFNDNHEKEIVLKICDLFPVIDLSREIVDKVISIRQKHKIKLPDAIILASATLLILNL